MKSRWKLAIVVLGISLLAVSNLTAVGAQGPPDMTKYGYPTVAQSMDLAPDQAATITAGNRSVAIKAGTFDVPVTFDLLTADPGTWKALVQDRTIRDAFAFRVTDKATKAIIGTFKQPVVYTYTDASVTSTDAILNTTAANPQVITPNPAPITFAAGKASHPFTGAGVGWLFVSAPTTGAATTPAAIAQASPAASATTAPAASAPATTVATATRPAATTAPVATGTGGGSAVPATLPATGVARATGPALLPLVALGGGATLLIGGLFVMRRRATSVQR